MTAAYRRLVGTLVVAIVASVSALLLPAPADAAPASEIAVGPQYDTSHVYVDSARVDDFVRAFVATFGGASTLQIVATVTPTTSSTTSQLIQTPVGTVSVFGFRTPVPYPFGAERNGYLVADLDAALAAARRAGADVLVDAFPDPIGRDAIVQWPGGVDVQLYWHTRTPSYPPLRHIPDNRIYLSPDRADAFVHAFLAFSGGQVVDDLADAPGAEIGLPAPHVRRIRLRSTFGRMTLFVTDGHLPWPYGRETTGYEVDDLEATLAKARGAGARVLVSPGAAERSAMVEFPGGYIAEIHAGAVQP